MATMTDIARLANVSQATVSRVLNGSPAVSDETKARVMEWVHRLNYATNYSAKTLAENRSLLIGLVIPDLLNPFFTDIIYHVEHISGKNGYSILLFNSDGNAEKEKEIARTLKARQVDGVLAGLIHRESPLYHELLAGRIPTVLLTQKDEHFSSVSVSHEAGGKLAAEHFMEKSFEVFFFVGKEGDPKCRGYIGALEKNSPVKMDARCVDIGDQWFHTSRISSQAILQLYQEEPSLKQKRCGFFCVNDFVALGVLQALQQLEMNIGVDAGIIGFDDTYLCRNVRPTISSISQPKDEIGGLSFNLLLDVMRTTREGEKSEIKTLILEPRLVKRQSS